MRPVVPVVPLFVLLLAFSALAGCITSEEPPVPDPTDTGLRDGSEKVEVTSTTGAITGTVASDLFEPIAGATVTIIETVDTEQPFETKTAKDGTYTFNGVPPGQYTIWAAAPGYESKRMPAVVVAGEAVEIKFLLPVLPCEDCPYEDFREYVGIVRAAASWQVEGPIGCQIHPTPVWTVKNCGGIRFQNDGDNGEVGINVTDRAQTIFAALIWDPAGPLGRHLQFDLMCPEVPRDGNGGAVLDTEHACYFETPTSESPIIHRVDQEHWQAEGYNHTGDWAARVFATYGMAGTYDASKIDIGVAYEQRFTIVTEVWVNHAAPADHLPIPDA